MKRVGVLALQGDFERHLRASERAGAHAYPVRTAADLEGIHGLIIPGGESTTMLKLLDAENLFEPLLEFGQRRPIFGTCAGAILLATEVCAPVQRSLGLMHMAVERNAYGRQIDSTVVNLTPGADLAARTGFADMECVFIRAPIIRRVDEPARALLVRDSDPVLVEDGMHLAATFHPELTLDCRIHSLFLSKL